MAVMAIDELRVCLEAFVPLSAAEVADVARLSELVDQGVDLWARSSPLHVTGSALVVDPPRQRVLLRWHERLQRWAQVGGHADNLEVDPWVVAHREAREETGLGGLAAWPPGNGRRPIQIVVVPVPPSEAEPAHEHADIRYLFACDDPDLAKAESESTPLRWVGIDDALEEVTEGSLTLLLQRAKAVLG